MKLRLRLDVEAEAGCIMLDTFLWISLYLTEDAIAKLYMT